MSPARASRLVVFVIVVWSCVMSNVAVAFHESEDIDPAWTASRQMALMALAHAPITRAVVEKLKSASSVRAGQHDYWFLIRKGHAVKTKTARGEFLTLTPPARDRALRTARALARHLDMHLPVWSQDRYDGIVRCTCGDFSAVSRKGNHTAANLTAQFAKHIEGVRNGTFRKLRSEAMETALREIEAAARGSAK